MRSQRYQSIKKKLEPNKVYTLDEAIDFIKENKRKGFDETMEAHVNLRQAAGSAGGFSGTVSLPAGLIKNRKVAAFVTSEKIKEAETAGADVAGSDELIEKIKETGKADFEEAVAEPEMMSKLVKIAKILGPKGLMPNPKKGTITKDIASLIKKLKKGELFYKTDKGRNIHVALAKVSWEKEKIKENIKAFLESIRKSKPASGKGGDFVKQIVICSSMGPAIKIGLDRNS